MSSDGKNKQETKTKRARHSEQDKLRPLWQRLAPFHLCDNRKRFNVICHVTRHCIQ